MSGWILSLAVSLGLTLAFELPFAALRRLRKRDLALCALVNLLTNPLVVVCTLLWRAYVPHPDWALVAALEAATVVTEGLIYRELGEDIQKPFRFSLCANALSYGLGLIVNLLW